MSELEDRISSILNDPEQMDRIAEMAKSLMGGEAPQAPADMLPPELGDAALLGRLGRLLRSAKTEDSRQEALLQAMKPYLSERRRGKMERAIQIARMARIAQLAFREEVAEDV